MINRIYQKPFKTLDEQVEDLRRRGLLIEDEEIAKAFLDRVGYYRLSTYLFHLEPPGDEERSRKIKANSSFSDAMRYYEFDLRLRLIALEAISHIEIGIGTKWAYFMSERYGAHAYLDKENFLDEKIHQKGLESLKDSIGRNKENLPEVRHYFSTYSEPPLPPIGMILPLIKFGELVWWFQNTKDAAVKRKISHSFQISSIRTFLIILWNFRVLRNFCAHHRCLWNARFINRLPRVKSNSLSGDNFALFQLRNGSLHQTIEVDNRIYNELVMLAHFLLILDPSTSWIARLKQMVATSLSLEEQVSLGFPVDWLEKPIWLEKTQM